MLIFVFFLRINLTINVAHSVFLMHIQSLLSGYAPDIYICVCVCVCVCTLRYLYLIYMYLLFKGGSIDFLREGFGNTAVAFILIIVKILFWEY